MIFHSNLRLGSSRTLPWKRKRPCPRYSPRISLGWSQRHQEANPLTVPVTYDSLAPRESPSLATHLLSSPDPLDVLA